MEQHGVLDMIFGDHWLLKSKVANGRLRDSLLEKSFIYPRHRNSISHHLTVSKKWAQVPVPLAHRRYFKVHI